MSKENYQSIFSLINPLYKSELIFSRKNDCACRILAEKYNASAVSILLYDSKYDKLVNKGNYINPEEITISTKQNFKDKEIEIFDLLKNITFYDFLFHKFRNEGIPRNGLKQEDIDKYITEFQSPERVYFNYEYNFDQLDTAFVKEKVRVSILLSTKPDDRSEYLELDKGSSFFYNLKYKFLEEEKHDIGERVLNYGGRIYHNMLPNDWINGLKDKTSTNKTYFHSDDLRYDNDPHNDKFFEKLENVCNLKLKNGGTDMDFFGFPLISNARCIGVARLLYSKYENAPFTDAYHLRQDLTKEDKKKFPDKAAALKSISNSIEILGTCLDQGSYQSYVDHIPHDWTTSGRPTDTSKLDRKFCDGLRRAMNSYGVVLRLPSKVGKKTSIAGYSSRKTPAFKNFVKKTLIEDGSDGFIDVNKNGYNEKLVNYFSFLNKNVPNKVNLKYRLVATAIALSSEELVEEKYYYCHQKSEQVLETSELFLFIDNKAPNFSTLLHTEAKKRMSQLTSDEYPGQVDSIKYILILDIPPSEVDGIVTLSNTINRPFTLADVQFAYGEMKRLGLEKLRVKLEAHKTYKQVNNLILHDLTPLINETAPLLQSANFSLRIIGDGVKNKIKEAIYINQLMDLRFAKFSKRFDPEDDNFIPFFDTPNDIYNFIIDTCNIFSGIGFHFKGIGIRVNDENLKSKSMMTRFNRDVIQYCYIHMFENSIKYSYNNNLIENMGKNVNDVLVNLKEYDAYYEIEISNWGYRIENQREIFQSSNGRNGNAIAFCTDNNSEIGIGKKSRIWTGGDGKGLPNVKGLMLKINGDCILTSESKSEKTTFVLKISK